MTMTHGVEDGVFGGERRSDGLWIHRSLFNSDGLRAVGNQFSRTGRGMELIYDRANSNASIQSYDRDASAWTDLFLKARNINLQPQSGGTVNLPSGSVNNFLGQYRSTGGWFVPAANAWYESNAQVTGTTTGGRVRLEACGSIVSNTAGATVYIGFSIDGAQPPALGMDSQTHGTISTGGYPMPFSAIAYPTVAAGSHRFSIWVYTNNANNSGLWSGGYTCLYVTEQKG